MWETDLTAQNEAIHTTQMPIRLLCAGPQPLLTLRD
jgi:hypothetical protein